MRKNTLPAFHRCQQSAIMTSILYDLDSKKQIRYIADLLFHLCNISLSKLYTDLCNSVAATLISSLSWVITRMVLPFRASLLSLSAIRRIFCPSRPLVGSSRISILRPEKMAQAMARRCFCPPDRADGCVSLSRKGQIPSASVWHGLCFLLSIRYSAAVPPPHSP